MPTAMIAATTAVKTATKIAVCRTFAATTIRLRRTAKNLHTLLGCTRNPELTKP
jgi:hypothetical protein